MRCFKSWGLIIGYHFWKLQGLHVKHYIKYYKV
jgi:hypothetical protein